MVAQQSAWGITRPKWPLSNVLIQIPKIIEISRYLGGLEVRK